MSYNINIFKMKKLDNLIIPLSSLFKSERKDWHPEIEYNQENDKTIFWFMDSYISGYVYNEMLYVKEVSISGEGSGTSMHLIIEPALKDSTGELIVSCVWEGGDSINKLIVKNGNVEWKNIDI